MWRLRFPGRTWLRVAATSLGEDAGRSHPEEHRYQETDHYPLHRLDQAWTPEGWDVLAGLDECHWNQSRTDDRSEVVPSTSHDDRREVHEGLGRQP